MPAEHTYVVVGDASMLLYCRHVIVAVDHHDREEIEDLDGVWIFGFGRTASPRLIESKRATMLFSSTVMTQQQCSKLIFCYLFADYFNNAFIEQKINLLILLLCVRHVFNALIEQKINLLILLLRVGHTFVANFVSAVVIHFASVAHMVILV